MTRINPNPPTPDPELNTVLHNLVTSARQVLGGNFVAAYLQGSFALGDWDADSDVDFLIAIEHEASAADLPALQSMHAGIFGLECRWAKHLEGSYFPKQLLKRADPARTPLLYLDNMSRQLTRSDHDNGLVVRWIVRECGITLAGPAPKALIDPVPADDLREEVSATMRDWAREIFAGRYPIDNRWAQPFVVLSYCRMLHTLAAARIGSKPAGAEWAKRALDARWAGLIDRARDGRPNPSLKVRLPADPGDLERTLDFIRYALDAQAQFPGTKP
jgi:predicted nucleotidyltransferase